MSPSLPPSDAPDQFRAPPQSHPATSPIKLVAQPFVEHKRNEVQALVQPFVYDKDIHEVEDFKNRTEFFSLLDVPEGVMAKLIKDSGKSGNERSGKSGKSGEESSGKDSGKDPSHFSRKSFVRAANTLAESMKNDYFPKVPLLVFKSTDNQMPLGHLTDTACRPNVTAAFHIHWDNKPTTLWPCIRLAGKVASAGKKKEYQMKQAISYLHYLLLARPDLHVAQGFLISKERITFLFGIGGRGIRRLTTSWTDPQIMKLMFAFFYRVYEPGHFGDSSYVEMVPDFQQYFVKYTIRISIETQDLNCPGFYPVHATSPFGSRTHILSHPDSDICCNGKILSVVKDQLSPPDSRFDEYTILTSHVHSPETVPGVIEAVCHELIELPQSLGVSRVKHRIGLRQLGSPLMSIPTLREMLEVVFDVLEVLRFLRVNREVLHRDISKGNVLYMRKGTTPPPDASQKEVPICFIKYLLGESAVPQETSVLLIDFNHAEHLGSKPGDERTMGIGTPIFIARAVQQGSPVLPPIFGRVPAIPTSPESYALRHPGRIVKFPPQKALVFDRPSKSEVEVILNSPWRHELDHDAESVFWLLFYWLVIVQPHESAEEFIASPTWSNLTGEIDDRTGLLGSLSREQSFKGVTHSCYLPVLSLLSDLAKILDIDRHWFDKSDGRNDPEFVTEAFQRLILQFVLVNKEKEFMTKKVALKPRTVAVVPQHPSLLTTPSAVMDGCNRKRSSPSPSTQRQKRPRLDAEGATEDALDEDDEEEDEQSEEEDYEDKDLSESEDYEDEQAVFEDQSDSE